jgi:hypothetical protein
MLFATVLIGGSFILARGGASTPIAEASSESSLLAAVATQDSDHDGLPDWEEALYGTDPKNADTNGLGMTDGEAVAQGLIVPQAIADVPGATGAGALVNPDLPPAAADNTLTAAFSKNLFTGYMNALQNSGGQLSDEDVTAIANQALENLGNSITAAPPFKRLADLKVAGSGAEAMKAFANAADAVMRANPNAATKSEIGYLMDAEQNGDTGAIQKIRDLAKLYRSVAAGLAALPVPTELAQDDLALINAFAQMAEATNDLAAVNDDPLVTMLALHKYPDDVLALGNAFIKIQNDFDARNITFASGEGGATFVNLMRLIAVDQAADKAAAKKP